MISKDQPIRVVIGILSLVFLTSVGSIQATPLSDGINWLEANQDASGLWGADDGTPTRDVLVVTDVLSRLGGDETVVNGGLAAIIASTAISTDYLARKIIVLSGGGPSTLLDDLLARQNVDGGWGYQAGYGSNVLETALALRALKAGGHPAPAEAYNDGLAYLVTVQNLNGGWPFLPGDSSVVFYAAHALLALEVLAGNYDVATPLDNGVLWLKAQANGDDGFGTGGISNPYETTLAMLAIIKKDQATPILPAAVNYLETTQDPNGSWGDDAYYTAMAVLGLGYQAADLSILAADITLSNPTPLEADLVDVTAAVNNLGLTTATSILVRFFIGDPDFGGTQIGSDQIIPSLAPGAVGLPSVEWNTSGLTGDYQIFVLVDPLEAITEPDKSNNSDIKAVHVYMPPDFLITTTDISFDPAEPEPGQSLIIGTTVRNLGEVTALNIPLQIYNGDPDAGGGPLLGSPYIIPSIPAGAEFALNLNMGGYFSTAGDYEIYACADVGDIFYEPDEDNNCNFNTLQVGLSTDLVALYPGLNLLGLSLEPLEPSSAFDVFPAIPNCSELNGWDRKRQRWVSMVDHGGLVGDDFAIGTRDGFFARVTAPGNVPFRGRQMTDHVETTLKPGYNLLTVPNVNVCYSGYTLVEDITGCGEAMAFDASMQTQLLAERDGDSAVGSDYPISQGMGLMVQVDTASRWTTHACDTIPPPRLPDMSITAVDIFLNPNPGSAGTLFTIGVNVHNDGDTTAFSPLVSIYAGDPNAGGQHLRSALWPDIPVAGESGLVGWGNLEFPIPGAYEIYAVVDFNEEISELNESNNTAHATLTVSSPAPAGMMENKNKAELSFTIIEPKALVLSANATIRADLLPELPHREALSQRVAVVQGIKNAPSLSRVSATAAVSSRVQAGNHTGNSVTISWVTDEPADGLVNYGIAGVTEFAEYESGYTGEIHSVELGNLQEHTTYLYEVVSGDSTDNNDGAFYSFTTSTLGAALPAVLYGRVVDDFAAAAHDVLVTVSVSQAGNDAHPLIAVTDQDGYWVLNLGNLKDPATDDVFAFTTGDDLAIAINGPAGAFGNQTLAVTGASPQYAGTITMTACDCSNFCNVTNDAFLNPLDVTYMIFYVYRNNDLRLQIPTCPGDNGDWNCDGRVDAVDVVYFVLFVYRNIGLGPCDPCL